jgi:hypothetical protein
MLFAGAGDEPKEFVEPGALVISAKIFSNPLRQPRAI